MDTTSPSLLARVRDPADQDAWRRFDRVYGELIVRYCRRLGLQHADAEDVRQLVLARLSVALREFEYEPRRGRFRSFLGRVVKNEAIRYWARPASRRSGVSLEEDLAPASTQADAQDAIWEEEWRHHHLRRAMRALRTRCAPRSVEVFDALVAGQAPEEVAVAMDMTLDAVQKIKQRMRTRLRALVAAQVRMEDRVR